MAVPIRHRKTPARIAEVASIAGVSAATVSRALARPDLVSASTRDRVLEAVRATGYTPNIAARALRARRSMMVLVVVPDIANPFFAEVLRGVDETLSAAGYGLIIANLDNSAEKEARYVDLVFAGQVDGVLLLNGRVPKGDDRDLTAAGVPIVAACERIPGAPFPQVEIGNREAAAAVARHLLGLGHRRFAYVAGPPTNILEHDRALGFREGLAEAGLGEAALMRLPGDFTFAAGIAAGKAVAAAKPRPTAVFAANDEMAIGCLVTLRAAGLAVPRDVSIVGFDGIDYADFCEPALTTVRQPRRELGATAARLLVARANGEAGADQRLVQLGVELRIAGSSGPSAG